VEETLRPPRTIRFGCFEVDLRSGELRKKGLKIKLQEQPFQVLAMLLERPGGVVTREELRKKLWSDDTFVDFDQGLNRAINKIREALDDDAETPRFVETLPRRGYRFIAPVENGSNLVMEVQAPARTEEGVRPEPGLKSKEPTPPAPPKWTVSPRILVVIGVGLALAVTGALIHIHARRGRVIDSVAILPFANPSADPNTASLCEGITESLILNLSRLPSLKVVSYSSVNRYKQPTDPQVAGRELGVQAVLTGRVMQRADGLDIRMELVDVRDNTHLWGEQYEGKLADILMVQEEVSREITENLRLKLNGEEKKRVEAYRLYLKGRNYWNKRTAEGLNQAIQYMQQAIAKDPNHALAYAALADSYNMLARYGALAPRQAFPKAEAAARKALALDDQLAEAHTSLAFVKHRFQWDWSGAETEFRRAIQLNPNYAPARQWYSSFLAAMGRTDESIAEAKQARRLGPLSLTANSHLGWVLYLAHQPRPAIEQYQMTLQLDPDFFVARRYLGLAYDQAGLHEQAVAELQKAVVLSGGSPLTRAELAFAYSMAGRKAEAQKLLEELVELSKHEYVSPYLLATIHTGLGSKEQAFVWLEKATDDRDVELVYLKVDPRVDPLRSDPRFRDLLRRIGL